MIALRTAFPNPTLREFVRFYAQREVHPFESGATSVFEPIPARLEQILEFQFGVPFKVHHSEGHHQRTPAQAVVGAHVRGCAQIELTSGVVSFGVFFRPTGLSRLFGIPVRDMANRNYDAALIPAMAKPLRDQLAESVTFEERVHTMERFLLRLTARALGKARMVVVAEHVFSLRGVLRISQLAGDTGLGIRQFERQFLQEVGMSPKLYARVARFQSALDAKIAAPRRSWLEIAHDHRYHDQTHMIRDFQLLGGDTPKQLLSQIGDARPGALLPQNPAQE
jgi:AraC-like DNA-binding protein